MPTGLLCLYGRNVSLLWSCDTLLLLVQHPEVMDGLISVQKMYLEKCLLRFYETFISESGCSVSEKKLLKNELFAFLKTE